MNALRRADWGIIAVSLAVVLSVSPLWCVSSPAMPDYPAHLASYYLIATSAKAPAVAQFYHIQWAFIPNLAGEILVPLLSRVMALEAAAKIFVAASVSMWVIGPAAIHRALYGRVGAGSLPAALFAYNANLMWGFLNYYFAMGLGFLVFAAWIANGRNRHPLRLAGFALAVTGIYFSHLFACAVLAVMIGSYELGACLSAPRPAVREAWRRLGAVCVAFLPAALAFLFLKPHDSASTGAIAFDFADTWLDRATAALQHHHDDPSFTVPILLALLLVVALWRGWVAVDRRMVATIGVIGAITLLAPEWAMGGWGVHLRLPAVFAALVFASVALRAEKAFAAVVAGTLILIAYNAAALALNWRDYDRQFREFRDTAHALPPGSRLLTVLDGDAIGMRSDQPYWHMAEFAIIDPGAMTQLMFTTPDQHVVRLNETYQPYAAASAEQGSPPDVDELDDLAASRIDEDEDIANVFPYLMRYQCHYDKAVVIHLGGKRTRVPTPLRLYRAGTFFSIYDIRPTADCGRS
jgi:hypothetical protein